MSELEIASEAISFLRSSGDVSLVYITAEFAPFSNQRKPDVHFVPEHGKNAGEVFIIELKMLSGKVLQPHQIESIVEHRLFAMEPADPTTCHFAFATDIALSTDISSRLSSQGVHVISGVRDGKALARQIMLWSQS